MRRGEERERRQEEREKHSTGNTEGKKERTRHGNDRSLAGSTRVPHALADLSEWSRRAACDVQPVPCCARWCRTESWCADGPPLREQHTRGWLLLGGTRAVLTGLRAATPAPRSARSSCREGQNCCVALCSSLDAGSGGGETRPRGGLWAGETAGGGEDAGYAHSFCRSPVTLTVCL